MIVDLIRNDLGRVAQTGSVAGEDLFADRNLSFPAHHGLHRHGARSGPTPSIGDILRGLFPCGSVTGAPKIRAMEILRDPGRSSPRGAYCGALGYFAPDGRRASTSPSARSPSQAGRGAWHRRRRGAGFAGAEEYAECLLKARFFEEARMPLELIETMKHHGGFAWLDRHLARMAARRNVRLGIRREQKPVPRCNLRSRAGKGR